LGRQFNAIFFDLDGTLVDLHGPLYVASCRALRELGHDTDVSREHFRASLDGDDPWRNLASQYQPEYMKLVFAYLIAELDTSERLEVLPHVHETLAGLKHRGYATAVITSRPGEAQRLVEKLAMVGLAQHLDQVLTQEKATLAALDKTTSLKEAASYASLTPDECIYVGDEPRDIMAAANAGYGASIAVATGIVSANSLRGHPHHRASHVLDSMAELLPLIDRLRSEIAS
jgi:phosphoglycolate phosphatase-like HAD superfamily hydrolase